MKEDASAKELENLLREALNTGLETPRGGAAPLVQLKTVPLQVQHIPIRKAAPAPAPAVAVSVPAVDQAPDSIGGLADKLAPESVPPKAMKKEAAPKKKRTSTFALLGVGLFALAAAGGAVWFARHRHPFGIASAATTNTTPVAQATTQATSTEGAVGIAVASRPVDAPAGTTTPEAKTDVATPAPPPTFAAVPAAAPPVVANAKVEKSTPAPAEKAAPAEKPKSSHHSTAAAKPAPEPKPEKAEKSASADKPADKPAAAPAAPGASVDAILQQQLKGAIP